MWRGGIYYPPDYVRGTRYPLVIQTHSFDPAKFSLYGGEYPNFAAQPLAAVGMLVLQMQDIPFDVSETPQEMPAAQRAYESAVDHLDSLGMVDTSRVGLVGFSATS